ncbi:hypothetical protein FRC03_004192 [Tulasnella sp. 419]|nr:hypothetical protein FRC03_004192 [Tulasnella sp. 419]
MSSYDALRNSVFETALEIGLVDPNVALWIENKIPEEPEEEEKELVPEMVQHYNFKSMPSSSEDHSIGSRFSAATTTITSPPPSTSSHETPTGSTRGRGRFLFGFQRQQQATPEPDPSLARTSSEQQETTSEKRFHKQSKLKKSRPVEADLVVLPDSKPRGRSPSSVQSKKSDKKGKNKSRTGRDAPNPVEGSPDYGFLKIDPNQINDSDSGKGSSSTLFQRFRSRSRSKSRKRADSPPPAQLKSSSPRQGPPTLTGKDLAKQPFKPLELHLHTNSGGSSDTEMGSLNIRFPEQPSTTQISHARKPSNLALSGQPGRITPTFGVPTNRQLRQVATQGGPVRRSSSKRSSRGAGQMLGIGVARGPSYRRSPLVNKAGVGAGNRNNLLATRVISPTFNFSPEKNVSSEEFLNRKSSDEWVDEDVPPAKAPSPPPPPVPPINPASRLAQWRYPAAKPPIPPIFPPANPPANIPANLHPNPPVHPPVSTLRRPSLSPVPPSFPPAKLAPPVTSKLTIPSPTGRLRPLSPATNPPASPLPEPPKSSEPSPSANEYIGRALLAPASPSSALPTPTAPSNNNTANPESTWYDDEAEEDSNSGFDANYVVPSPGLEDSSRTTAPPGALGFTSGRSPVQVPGSYMDVKRSMSSSSRQPIGSSSAQLMSNGGSQRPGGRVPIQYPTPQQSNRPSSVSPPQRENPRGIHVPHIANGSNVPKETADIVTRPARLAIPQSRPSTAPSSDSSSRLTPFNNNSPPGRISPASGNRSNLDVGSLRPSPSVSPVPHQRGKLMPFPANPISASSSPAMGSVRLPPVEGVSPGGLQPNGVMNLRPGLPVSPAPSSRPTSPAMMRSVSPDMLDGRKAPSRQSSLSGIPVGHVARYSNLPISALLPASQSSDFTPERTVNAAPSAFPSRLAVPSPMLPTGTSPNHSPISPIRPLSPARGPRSNRPSTAPSAAENLTRKVELATQRQFNGPTRAPSPGFGSSSHGSVTSSQPHVSRPQRSPTDPTAMLSIRNQRAAMESDYEPENIKNVIPPTTTLYRSNTLNSSSPVASSQFTPRTEASSYETDDDWEDDDEGAHLEAVLSAYDDDSDTEGMGEGSRIIAAMHGGRKGQWAKDEFKDESAREKERGERREARERLTRNIQALNMRDEARLPPPAPSPMGRTGVRMI